MLLPLWAALILLASTLGLSSDQTADKYVYITASASPDAAQYYAGMACDSRFGYDMDYCGDLPNGTAILYHWGGYTPDYERFTLRHEIEHLLRGPDGPDGDRNNEAAADVAGCSVFYVSYRCGG